MVGNRYLIKKFSEKLDFFIPEC